MSGENARTGDGPGEDLDAARGAIRDARRALERAERAVERAESAEERRPARIRVDGPTWTWRERLWAAPAETRVGVRELVEALDVSESWIYSRTKADAEDPIPHRKIGGSLVFLVGEVRHWIREHEEAPVQGPSWSPVRDGLGVVESGRGPR